MIENFRQKWKGGEERIKMILCWKKKRLHKIQSQF